MPNRREHYRCYIGKHTKEMEEERKNAMEVGQEEEEEGKEGPEEKGRRALIL